MLVSPVKKFLYIIVLLVSQNLAAATLAEAAVASGYFQWYSAPTITVKPVVGNLLKYHVTFANPCLAQQEGYVDEDGNFIILGSQIVTDPAVIAVLKANSTALPQFVINNMEAYTVLSETGSQKIIFIDIANRYAAVGGSFNCLSCTVCVPSPSTPPPAGNSIQSSVLPNTPSKPGDANCAFTIADAFTGTSATLAAFFFNQRCTLGTFLQGNPNAPKILYVLFEPNCPFCNALYIAAKPFVEAGELAIHWAGVFFLNPTSFGKNIAILQGNVPGAPCSTPAQALDYDETNFNVPEERGGIPPATCVSFNAAAAINRNQQFFFTYTNQSTPFIFFRNQFGNAEYSPGFSLDFATFLKTVGPSLDCSKKC